MIHESLEYRPRKLETAGISCSFGFASVSQIATTTKRIGDDGYQDLIIPMSNTVAQAAGSYHGSSSNHFDTLGHESVHLVSMRCGLDIRDPLMNYNEYGDDVAKAIALIKGQPGWPCCMARK